MRTHGLFPGLQPWRDHERLKALVHPERFVALRIEPVMRSRRPAVILDLHFDDGTQHVAIPLVLLDVARCAERDGDPLVFPAIASAIDDRVALALIERVLDVLLPAALLGDLRREELIVLGDARRVEAAREREWFGAAPLERTIPAIAPAVYARRFSGRRSALAYGPNAPALGAFLVGSAQTVTILGGDVEALAWYGVEPSEPERVDLAVGTGPAPVAAPTVLRTDAADGVIVPIVRPLAADVLVSFDPHDGPTVGAFYVERVPEPTLRTTVVGAPAIVGRSAGRIALVVRPRIERNPDADLDEAQALAAGLGSEGFDARIVSGVEALAAFEPDLVHLIGVEAGDAAGEAAAWAERRSLPLCVHAYETASYGFWGALATLHAFDFSGDERTLVSHLRLLAQRRIEVDGIVADRPYVPPKLQRPRAVEVLRRADLVFATSPAEAETLRALGLRGEVRVVPPAVPLPAEPEPIGALVGDAPFALAFGPIRPEANQLVLLQAAAAARLPLVLVGSTEDVAFAEQVRTIAGDHVILLPEPTPGVRSALLAAARVVVDAGWVGRGSARLQAAVLAGAVPVVARSRFASLELPPHWCFDPATVPDAARALGDAWDAALRRDAAVDTVFAAARDQHRRSIAGVLEGYATLASPARQPAPSI